MVDLLERDEERGADVLPVDCMFSQLSDSNNISRLVQDLLPLLLLELIREVYGWCRSQMLNVSSCTMARVSAPHTFTCYRARRK